jgi:hypothetical protein
MPVDAVDAFKASINVVSAVPYAVLLYPANIPANTSPTAAPLY